MRAKWILLGFLFCGFIIYYIYPHDKSRKNHKNTLRICNRLYYETFSIFGQGAWGGDRDAGWLTDSTTFRIFLGVFDNAEGGISVQCENDSILVTQRPDGLDVNKNIKSPVTKIYHLKELEKLQNLNDF